MVDIDENGNIKIKLNDINNFTELETIYWSDDDKLTFVSEYKYNKLKNKLEKIKDKCSLAPAICSEDLTEIIEKIIESEE